MHESSFEKIRAFRNVYIARAERPIRVLDVGSGCNPGSNSYRDLFPTPAFDYVGLDIEHGHGVDLVPDDVYSWSELPNESFDVVVSGQTFEHNPYFWITAAEIARILRPGGMVALIAPSAGYPHRYPLDCWRFYPDSWSALCGYVGLDLVESSREKAGRRKVIRGVYWRDAMMVARKPELSSPEAVDDFYGRLEAIVATRRALPAPSNPPGPAALAYEQAHTLAPVGMLAHPFRLIGIAGTEVGLGAKRLVQGVRLGLVARNGRMAARRGDRLAWPPESDG